MALVALHQLIDPTRASTIGFTDPTSDERERVEFYAGIINIGFRGDGGQVHREKYQSFLPKDGGFHILTYAPGTEIDATVICVPNSVAGDDDEANVAAVDTAIVQLKPQTFPGIGGNPLCLILDFKVAALNTTLHSVSYHVTIIHKIPRGSKSGDGDTLTLNGSARPT